MYLKCNLINISIKYYKIIKLKLFIIWYYYILKKCNKNVYFFQKIISKIMFYYIISQKIYIINYIWIEEYSLLIISHVFLIFRILSLIIVKNLLLLIELITSFIWSARYFPICKFLLKLDNLPYKKLGYVFYTFCIRFVYVFKKSTVFIRNWLIFCINYTFYIFYKVFKNV